MNSQPVALDERVLGTRVIAALIDVAILAALAAVMAVATGGAESNETASGSNYSLNLNGLPFLAWVVIALAYSSVLEAASGQTVGKRVMNLRVVREDGGRPTLGQVVARNLMRLIDVLPAFYLVGFIAAAIDGEGRRLGDMAAGTRVCRRLSAWETQR